MLIHAVAEYWMAIVAAAVAVFIASSLLWAVLPWHRSDYGPLPDEDAAQAGLGAGLTPGLYALPHAPTPGDMQREETKRRIEQGPMALITVLPPDVFSMGKRFGAWFAFTLAVGAVSAFMLELSLLGLEEGDPRVTGVTLHVTAILSFLAYGGAYVSEAIWFSRTWRVVAKYLLDALVYAALTAAAFYLLG